MTFLISRKKNKNIPVNYRAASLAFSLQSAKNQRLKFILSRSQIGTY